MSELRSAVIIPMIIAILFLALIGFISAAQAKDGGINPNGYYGTIRQKFDKKHPGVNKVLSWGVFVVFSVLWVRAFHAPFVDFIKNDPQKQQGIIVAAGRYPNTFATFELENGEVFQAWFGNPKMVFDQRCEILYAPRSKIAIRIDPIES